MIAACVAGFHSTFAPNICYSASASDSRGRSSGREFPDMKIETSRLLRTRKRVLRRGNRDLRCSSPQRGRFHDHPFGPLHLPRQCGPRSFCSRPGMIPRQCRMIYPVDAHHVAIAGPPSSFRFRPSNVVEWSTGSIKPRARLRQNRLIVWNMESRGSSRGSATSVPPAHLGEFLVSVA
jgi:hypothetical protein